MPERKGKVDKRELARLDLESKVRALTPELIRNSEHAERIRQNFQDGVIAMSMFMIMDAEENEDEPKDHAFENCWSFQDFARTVLTNPLPEEQLWAHYEGNKRKAPPEVVAADETDWWAVLTDEQKVALFDVFDLRWDAIRHYVPTEEDRKVRHIVFMGEDASIKSEEIEGYVAYPAILWNPHHGLCITAVPFLVIQHDQEEETPPDFTEVSNGAHSQDTE